MRQESKELCLDAVYTKTFLQILGMAVSATARLRMPFSRFALAVPIRKLSIYAIPDRHVTLYETMRYM